MVWHADRIPMVTSATLIHVYDVPHCVESTTEAAIVYVNKTS